MGVVSANGCFVGLVAKVVVVSWAIFGDANLKGA